MNVSKVAKMGFLST